MSSKDMQHGNDEQKFWVLVTPEGREKENGIEAECTEGFS